jgi:hypothetical protein
LWRCRKNSNSETFVPQKIGLFRKSHFVCFTSLSDLCRIL